MLANKYFINNLVGKGKFGKVYSGHRIKTNEQVAVKIEDADSPIKLLKNETCILNYLYHNGCRKIPFIYWFGNCESSPCLVMSFYEMSLVEYASIRIAKELSTIKSMIKEIVNILKSIHDSHVIHRDVKPQNFMIKNEEIYLVDFGLSTVFIDDSKKHIPETKTMYGIIGTPKYISIHLHEGSVASRRDDIISCGYIYLYLILEGHLPWENLPELGDTEYDENHIMHNKNRERARQKSLTNIQNYCFDIDESVVSYLKYAYSISFSERPNYENLIS
jgi:serine/threonine protein kinase